MFFSWLDRDHRFREEDHRGKEVKCPSYPIISRPWTVNMIYVDVDLDHLAEVVFIMSLHCKVTFTSPPSILYSWKEVTVHNLPP